MVQESVADGSELPVGTEGKSRSTYWWKREFGRDHRAAAWPGRLVRSLPWSVL